MGVLPGMGHLPASSAAPAQEAAPARRKRAAKKGKREPAVTHPVARVAVDMSLPHLDRPFDYLVPTTLDAAAVPGCRARVRCAGQLVDGCLLERGEESDHEGRLAVLERVTSPEPVLTPEIAALAREIADRYAGTLADVLRLAIPPRHARVEAERAERSASEVVEAGAERSASEEVEAGAERPASEVVEVEAERAVSEPDEAGPERAERPAAEADEAGPEAPPAADDGTGEGTSAGDASGP